MWMWIAPVTMFVLWSLAHSKTSRPEGTLLRIPPFRRIMQYIMPTRNESVVYFDAFVDAEKLLAFLEKSKAFQGNMTHATVAAANIALACTPKMNRFVAGRRLYQRDKRWLTFSIKRARMDREAQISTVKLEMKDGETFQELIGRMNGGVREERSGKKTRGDKELDLFNFFPRPFLRVAAWGLTTADYFNLLPGAFIHPDPMFTSIFIANLGSLNMGAGYHHLFEYGNCPLFIMVGKVEEKVVPHEGAPAIRKVLHLRFTYDERIEDGLNARFGIDKMVEVLHDPEAWLMDGALWPRAETSTPATPPPA